MNLCQNEYVLTASVSVLRQYELFKTLKEFFFSLSLSVSARTSPKAQRPPQSSRTVRAANSHAQSTGTFSQLL